MDLFGENIDFMLFESLREDGIFLEEQGRLNKKRLKRLLAKIKDKYKGFDRGAAEKIIRKFMAVEKIEVREAIDKLDFEGEFVKALTRMDERDAIRAAREIMATLQKQGVEFYERSDEPAPPARRDYWKDEQFSDYSMPAYREAQPDRTITTQIGGEEVEIDISTPPREDEPTGWPAADEEETPFLSRIDHPDGRTTWTPIEGYTWANKDDDNDLRVIPIPPAAADPDPDPPSFFDDWLDTADLPEETEYEEVEEWLLDAPVRLAPGAPSAEEEPEDEDPQIRISTELESGDIGAYKFMGQTKTIGDPTDKKVLEYFKNDETIPMSDKGPEIYAALAKNYAMHSLLSGELKAGIFEEESKIDAKMAKAVTTFATHLAGNLRREFDTSVEKTKDLRKSFAALEKQISSELEELKKSNKDAMKKRANAKHLTKNYKVFARLNIKLANDLMEALSLMYVEASQALQDKTDEEGEEKMQVDTEVDKTKLNEDKLVEIVIDFNEIRKKEINESFLAMFGGWVEHILKAMFGGFDIPVAIRGTDREVQSFAAAIGSEKRYVDVAKRYGLDHPSTYRSKAQLQSAAKNFERDTGIKWPFK